MTARSDDPAANGERAAPEEEARRPRDFVQSVERALAIIRAFGPRTPAMTVSEIAAATDLTRAAARRFLLTLEELGYVRSDGRSFSLTPRVLELGYAFLSSLSLPEVAEPHLEQLVAESQESTEGAILDGDGIVYVMRRAGPAIMNATVPIGSRMPAAATALGRVLLAGLPDDELDRFLAEVRLTAYLPNTIVDRSELRAELMRVREQGWALVDQELEEGLLAIAVPIRDRRGTTIAAVNLSTHVARRTPQDARELLLPPLRRAAAGIESGLAR